MEIRRDGRWLSCWIINQFAWKLSVNNVPDKRQFGLVVTRRGVDRLLGLTRRLAGVAVVPSQTENNILKLLQFR